MKRLLRLFGVLFLAYWLGCALMVAATPRAQRFDCHGRAKQDCFQELIQSRRARLRKTWWWRADAQMRPSATPGPQAASA